MKMQAAVIITGLLMGAAVTLPGANAAAAKKAPASAMVYCPLMDYSVKKSQALKSNYKGKTYFFCCDDCKKMFDKNPAKMAADYNKKATAHATKKG